MDTTEEVISPHWFEELQQKMAGMRMKGWEQHADGDSVLSRRRVMKVVE